MLDIKEFKANSKIKDTFRIKDIYVSFLRNKNAIIRITFISLLISVIYAFLVPRVWRAKIQILIKDDTSGTENSLTSAFMEDNPMFSKVSGLGNDGRNDKTRIKIFNSPKVLKPIYNFVKNQKEQKNKKFNETFPEWRSKRVSIVYIPNTYIIKVAYDDKDKDLALPTIDKIYSALNNFLKDKREKSLVNALNYLNEEKIKLIKKSNYDSRKAMEFALDNNLGISDGLPKIINQNGLVESTGYRISGGIAGTGEKVENAREVILNNINAAKFKLETINKDEEKSVFISNDIPQQNVLNTQLNDINLQIAKNENIYRSSDEYMVNLKKERVVIKKQLHLNLIKILNSEIIQLEAELASISRPKNVILKHKELVRDAIRTNKSLSDIQKMIENVNLAKAKQVLPWDIISGPKLLSEPVSPVFLRIFSFGIFSGLIIGLLYAVIKDKKAGIISDEEDLKTKINLQKLADFSNKSENNLPFDFIFRKLVEKKELKNICFVKVGNISSKSIQNLKNIIKKTEFSNFTITSNYSEVPKFDNQILLFSIENILLSDLKLLNDYSQYEKINPLGYFII